MEIYARNSEITSFLSWQSITYNMGVVYEEEVARSAVETGSSGSGRLQS